MSLRTKSCRVAIQTKFLYLYFHMVLFVFAICLWHFAFGHIWQWNEFCESVPYSQWNGGINLFVVVVVFYDSLLWFSSSFGLG